jgi:hypothetical protein
LDKENMTINDEKSIENDLVVRASFVLRCVVGSDRQMRAHLLDVRTGNSYPLSDLNKLPQMVELLLKPFLSVHEIDGCLNEV